MVSEEGRVWVVWGIPGAFPFSPGGIVADILLHSPDGPYGGRPGAGVRFELKWKKCSRVAPETGFHSSMAGARRGISVYAKGRTYGE